MGARIKNITTQQTIFSPTLKLLVDKPDTGSGDWLQARAMELALLGNTYMQGSNNGINWHDNIISSDTYFRFSTDGGTTWKNLDADSIQEGVTNKFYTETKVSANTDVAANTAARHSHSNKSILDNIINSGTGHNFLADDGTYKNFEMVSPLVVNGDIIASDTITGGTFTDGVLDITDGAIADVNSLSFNTSSTPSYAPYTLFKDSANKTLSFYTEIEGTSLQIGQETWTYVYNNTGSTINNGKIVRISGTSSGIPLITLASNENFEDLVGLLGIVTHDIVHGAYGYVTTFGEVRNLNTAGCSDGSTLYLGTSGSFTTTLPPYPNYTIEIGTCLFSDSVAGKILVDVKGQSSDIIKNSFNGSFLESMSFTVTSDGTTITGTLQRNGGGDLTMNFSTGFFRLDTTPPLTIVLPAGTDTSPIRRYVYVPRSTKILTVGSSWPSEEHIKVSTLVLQSALATQNQGVMRNQNWNDHLGDSTGTGHIQHINERIRLSPAEYYSGVDPLVTVVTQSGTPDNVYFSTTVGKVYQMHMQDFDAQSMPTADIHVVNSFTTPYRTVTDLNLLLTDASGASLSGRSFSFVIWGVQNESGENSHLMLNLPTNSYTSSANAILDPSNYSVYNIPNNFRGVGFLIARITLSHSTSNGGTWTVNQTQDLRGYLPNLTAGSGAVGGSSGITSILQLTDVLESAFTGSAGKFLKVNTLETGMEFGAESDPIFVAHTTYNITNGTGFLKNNGTGTWSYDSSTYLTTTTAASTYQPADADLTAIAALTGTTGFLKKTAANTWSLDTNTYLTSETDPIVGAITGIIKANGAGIISAASAGTDYEVPITFSTGLSRATNTVTVVYGTTSASACVGNDSRLSDARTPTDNSVTEAKLASAYKNMEAISGTVLDWANMGGTKTLSADTTFTFSNLRKGAYFLETSGDYSPTFPTGFNYAGGTRAATGTTLYQIVCTNATTPIGWYIILKTES